MNVYHNLYLGDSLTGRKSELTWKLRHQLKEENLFLIILPQDQTGNLLEIYGYEALCERRNVRELWAVGAAGTKEEAIEVVRRMIDEIYQETGELRIREYLTAACSGK